MLILAKGIYKRDRWGSQSSFGQGHIHCWNGMKVRLVDLIDIVFLPMLNYTGTYHFTQMIFCFLSNINEQKNIDRYFCTMNTASHDWITSLLQGTGQQPTDKASWLDKSLVGGDWIRTPCMLHRLGSGVAWLFSQLKNITLLSIFVLKRYLNAPYTKPLLGLKLDIHTRMHKERVNHKN